MRDHVVSTGHTSWTEPSIILRRAQRDRRTQRFYGACAPSTALWASRRFGDFYGTFCRGVFVRSVDGTVSSSKTESESSSSSTDDSSGPRTVVYDSTDPDGDRGDDGHIRLDVSIVMDPDRIETRDYWLPRYQPDPPEWTDPSDDSQSQLGEFEDIEHSDDSDDSGTWEDRLGDLPKFLDESEIPTPSVDNASRIGPGYCTQCGERHSLDEPAESGVGALRAGDKDDGPSNYIPCDRGDIRSCDCCGCPSCGAKGIRARKTKDPTFACNNPNCGHEFDNPIARPEDEQVERERLYWTCSACGGLTQADFAGIPVHRLD